jgi:hypothetical protein
MDLGKLFGGIDMDEVGRAVSFVIENQDDFGRMITQFKNLPDGAAALMHQLTCHRSSPRSPGWT